MKVLVISPRTSGIGGIAYHTKKLIEFLGKNGIETEKISVENTPYLGIKGLMNPSFSLSSSLKVIFLRLKNKKYDVVHAHNFPSSVAMKLVDSKKILTSHGVYSEQILSLHGSFLGNLARKFERKAIEWTDAFTVVSRSTKEFYEKLGFKVEYIPNAIDFSEIPKEKITLYENQVTYVGRLSYEKGVDLLVEVARNLPSMNFLIIGNGPMYNYLKKASEKMKNIFLLGYKVREEALKYVAGSKAFILPSRNEGLSTSILEAMALKVPVVATNVGGNVELVSNGTTGYLARTNDVNSLMDSLKEAVYNESKEIVENAFNQVKKFYNWEVVIKKYIELYKRITEES